MRKLTDHEINNANAELTVAALDEPGAGGACHLYRIGGFDTSTNPVSNFRYDEAEILFQNGPIGEVGVNGVTHEALLAILIDRLTAFQSGKYACEENQIALEYLQGALATLRLRTIKRIIRGVEGTHEI